MYNKLAESLKSIDKLTFMTNQTTNGTVLLKFIKTADQKSPLTWAPYLEKGPLQMFSVVMSLITSYLAKYSQLPLSVKNWKLERKTDLPIWNMLVLHVESFESKNVQFIFCRAKLYWELWPCWCINVPLRPPDPRVMVYSQDGGHEWDRDQELDQWVLMFCRNVHTGPRPRLRPGPIDSCCTSPVPCIVSGPSLMQCE